MTRTNGPFDCLARSLSEAVIDVNNVNELDARLRTASAAKPTAADLARTRPGVDQVDTRPEACRASSDAIGAPAIHRVASAVLATVAWLPFLVAPLTFPPAR
jgi:hypothetical protein